jgi:hypothetical protein
MTSKLVNFKRETAREITHHVNAKKKMTHGPIAKGQK